MRLKLKVHNLLIIIKKNYIVLTIYVCFALIFSIYNCLVKNSNDDIWFHNIMDLRGGFTISNIFSFLGWRYYDWTSRLSIEFFLVIFVRTPILFRIINVVFGILILFFTRKIIYIFCKKSTFFDILIVCLVLLSLLLIQCGDLDAGITATFINYVWPFSISLISIYIVCAELFKTKVSGFIKILSIFFLLVISLWSESIVSLLFIFNTILMIYYFFFKKINVYNLICFLLSLLFIIFIITCPGNKSRIQHDIERSVPWFANLTFLTKLIGVYFLRTKDLLIAQFYH